MNDGRSFYVQRDNVDIDYIDIYKNLKNLIKFCISNKIFDIL